MNEETQEEDREYEETQRPVDPPQEKNPHKRKPAWVQEAIHIRGNLGSKMGLIRKRAKISFCELEFKNQ